MRILFLTHRLPYAPNRGDRVRAYHLLRQLRTFADVDLVSLVHDDEEASHGEDLRSLASTVSLVRVPRTRNLARGLLALPTRRPMTHVLLNGPGLRRAIDHVILDRPPSVVFAYCTGVAPAALEPPLRDVPLVLDMVDVDSAKWAALARTVMPPRSWIYAREARLLSRFERAVARRAFATLVVTDKERDTLLALAPEARIDVVQNGVDGGYLWPPTAPTGAPIVVFCGVMNYEPNVEAAVWLGRSVWPLVRKKRPTARLEIVGSHPTGAVRRLADPRSGIDVTGEVADVRPHLWRAAVAAAPLRTARGVQNKVLEAVAAGLPVVVTPAVLDGIPPEIRPACDVAQGAGAFADALIALLDQSPSDRRERASRADVVSMSWDRRLKRVPEILVAASRS